LTKFDLPTIDQKLNYFTPKVEIHLGTLGHNPLHFFRLLFQSKGALASFPTHFLCHHAHLWLQAQG